jgi:3-phosphoshikimate 1-carboxyvinyltransferase
MDGRRICKIDGPLDAVLRATSSKSVTHRALVAAALADGESVLYDPLDADDTRATRDGLVALGVAIRAEPGRWIVQGCGGWLPGAGSLSMGESGTTMRFLTAVAALGQAASRLDGAPRLRERPVGELAAALEQLGGTIHPDPATGGLPLTAGGSPMRGGAVSLPGSRSSQFASALLLIGPRLQGGLELSVEPPAVSLPYVDVTVAVLAAFGVSAERVSELRWRVAAGDFAGRDYRVEGDHSSASYFLAAAALVGGRVRVRNLSPTSAQPDARLGAILRGLGCRVETGSDWIEVEGDGRIPGFDLELAGSPDIVPTLAVLALFAEGPCVIRGVAHLRHKESDRLEVLARNLRTLGRHAAAFDDRLVVDPPPPCLGGGRITTASDHRMAMAFAVAGLRVDGVVIDDPACVTKSNPGFWNQLGALAARPDPSRTAR